MSSPSDLISRIDSIVAERALLNHPFYQQWSCGTLSLERLREYAVQYYHHVRAFPRYLSAIHSRCDDLETRQALLENLIEEERGANNHPELWLRFAEGIGAPRQRVLEGRANAATAALVETFARLCGESPLPAGLAALYVYESQIPTVATAKIEGLRRFYAIEDDRTLEFFTVHQEADRYHAQTDAELLKGKCRDTDGREAALHAAEQATAALWNMLDGV